MKKLNTTLLIITTLITTLIAIFFLCEWVNDVRPRYEWKERIEVVEFLEEITFDHDCDGKANVFCEGDVLIQDCLGIVTNFYEEPSFCYIKEKVRIN